MRFEKVSDIDDDFCHLDVFVGNEKSARIDVSLDENQEAIFTIYPCDEKLELSLDDLVEILDRAKNFVKDEIENEEAFNRMQ